ICAAWMRGASGSSANVSGIDGIDCGEVFSGGLEWRVWPTPAVERRAKQAKLIVRARIVQTGDRWDVPPFQASIMRVFMEDGQCFGSGLPLHSGVQRGSDGSQ